ncbi:MAG: FAD-binding oxidoreductase [Bacteroidota bacterium]
MTPPWSSIPDLRCLSASELQASGRFAEGSFTRLPIAVLQPHSLEQVIEIVRLAARENAPLYTVSQGKNWGLGGAIPTVENCTLVDLSAMDTITHYDATAGTVRVQPGVTFAQLAAFLEQHASPWQCSVTGGPSQGSVLGNALDRGDGTGWLGDRAQSIFDLTVVLGTGEVVRTGHGAPLADPIAFHGTPCGPGLTPLFVQSNLGIVGEATVQLESRSRVSLQARYSLASPADWDWSLRITQRLMHEHLVHPREVTYWNQAKWMARVSDQQTTLNEQLSKEELCRWLVSFSVASADAAILRIKRKAVERIVGTPPRGFQLRICKGKPLHAPTDQNLRSLYWELDQPVGANPQPDQDGARALWVCAAVPYALGELLHAIHLLESAALAHGLHPNVGFQVVSHAAVHIFLLLSYNPTRAGHRETALACQAEALEAMDQAGFPQVRLGIHTMPWMATTDPAHQALLSKLKQALDPKGILSPGRYIQVP